MSNDDTYREKSFSDDIIAKIYAWYLRRKGYVTHIDEIPDIAPTGWLWAFTYTVTAHKKGIY